MPDIIAMGEPLIEFNQTRASSDEQRLGFGGDTSNCAIAAARAGASVGYFTAVGYDKFGDQLMELWRENKVDASRVIRNPAAPTGIYFVTHGPDGHSFSYRRAGSAASLIDIKDVPRGYIAGAKVLHVSGISMAISTGACDAAFEAIELARSNGVKVSIDPNLRLKLWPLPRARALIHAAMAQCDIALPGIDDASVLTGTDEPEAIADFYLGLGAKIVALTLGKEGCLVATPERRERIDGFTVEAVDASGAGDTFDGNFLAEYLVHSDPFAAARFANAAAALATRDYGAVAPMPRRAEVLEFLDSK